MPILTANLGLAGSSSITLFAVSQLFTSNAHEPEILVEPATLVDSGFRRGFKLKLKLAASELGGTSPDLSSARPSDAELELGNVGAAQDDSKRQVAGVAGVMDVADVVDTGGAVVAGVVVAVASVDSKAGVRDFSGDNSGLRWLG
ncbi:hypothetical protein NL676_033918 [Syzygium grande]|nr:hypothetical protein NL676_033918 [Syzygium grande]